MFLNDPCCLKHAVKEPLPMFPNDSCCLKQGFKEFPRIARRGIGSKMLLGVKYAAQTTQF